MAFVRANTVGAFLTRAGVADDVAHEVALHHAAIVLQRFHRLSKYYVMVTQTYEMNYTWPPHRIVRTRPWNPRHRLHGTTCANSFATHGVTRYCVLRCKPLHLVLPQMMRAILRCKKNAVGRTRHRFRVTLMRHFRRVLDAPVLTVTETTKLRGGRAGGTTRGMTAVGRR